MTKLMKITYTFCHQESYSANMPIRTQHTDAAYIIAKNETIKDATTLLQQGIWYLSHWPRPFSCDVCQQIGNGPMGRHTNGRRHLENIVALGVLAHTCLCPWDGSQSCCAARHRRIFGHCKVYQGNFYETRRVSIHLEFHCIVRVWPDPLYE